MIDPGDSLDRLQNTDSDADEDKPALNARASQEEHEAERHRRAIAKATKKELSKRESAKQNTLSDILRLKAEINDVTSTLKVESSHAGC